ncbi:flagellar basal-body rod protein FlgF [Rhizobium sp. RU20A]|uniref:flagellar basal-body rod protein FlgF n=1 Tax=Rhizobium sp. RU20A TaxID=1907412 RepID=UPI00095589D1|nr:flagellar basal-body rod protein FlgF [Rhizobium sp. RU20A]SIQ56193.1 flagellar basal-body rod protein FlgF [Rhizobium sp. RU20A]
MQTGLYVALSSQVALERRINTLADNVANASTAGFRGTQVKFDEVLASTGASRTAFVSPGEEYLDTNTGGFKQTGNSLDVAIKGDAYFQIQTPSGAALTRDGRFSMAPDGSLISTMGFPVLDIGGGPIQLNANGGEIRIGADGVIRQGEQQVAQIGLFEADFSRGFTRVQNSGIIPVAEPQAVVDNMAVGVAQGYIEESNVNPIQEMSQLINIQRAFDSISSLMRDTEQTFGKAIETLGGSRG